MQRAQNSSNYPFVSVLELGHALVDFFFLTTLDEAVIDPTFAQGDGHYHNGVKKHDHQGNIVGLGKVFNEKIHTWRPGVAPSQRPVNH